MGLPVQVHEVLPKKPVVVMTWEGSQPTLPSVLLNSHMDVVPVFEVSNHAVFQLLLSLSIEFYIEADLNWAMSLAALLIVSTVLLTCLLTESTNQYQSGHGLEAQMTE